MEIEVRMRSRLSQLMMRRPLQIASAKSFLLGLGMFLTLLALWAITHRYKEVTGDAELYAVQALARIYPQLAGDLYLKFGSQDHFTVFSPFYAWCIEILGLQDAALTLTILCAIGFFAAAWQVAARATAHAKPELCVALLMITAGSYGAYGVFHYAEVWITARSVAEFLVVTALACHLTGSRKTALGIVISAMFVHPIMALPGLLIIMCLRIPLRMAAIGAIAGILLALAIASDPFHLSPEGAFGRMDTSWLEVVRERSVFLFPQFWSFDDWQENIRPILSLLISALALPDEKVRKLCICAILIGITGLTIATVAGRVGPVAILLQGQAWRWVWLTSFLAVLMIAPSVGAIYVDARVGPLTALALIAGWTFPALDGCACVLFALLLWLARDRVDSRVANILRWAAFAFVLIMGIWFIATSWSLIIGPNPDVGRESPIIQRIRNVLGLEGPALLLAWFLMHRLRAIRSGTLACTCVALAMICVAVLPGSLKQNGPNATRAALAEFEDWRRQIPPDSNVYVAPSHNAASFAWFTLVRPSYLSVDQSAGAVFSAATAREVRRRSQVLLPLIDPDWKLLTGNRKPSSQPGVDEFSRPFTKTALVAVCGDDELDFVIAKGDVGIDASRHPQRGFWKDWSLYDCRSVRSSKPST